LGFFHHHRDRLLWGRLQTIPPILGHASLKRSMRNLPHLLDCPDGVQHFLGSLAYSRPNASCS
jgi:hypothetical protein